MEPIQGEGGDNHFRKEFFQALRKLADKYEALLVMDEVQTGVGLTGKMWAYEHFGFVPDMIAFGKKTQVCGICSTDRIDEVPHNVFKISSRINSTWGGNLVDMVRCKMFLDIINEDNLIENAKEVGRYFLEKLNPLPINNVRGRGLMIAFDLEDETKRDAFLQKLLKKGVLALSCGQKSVRVRPHLTFSKENVDEAIDIIESSF
jgi:L-lysine 6-transaminase